MTFLHETIPIGKNKFRNACETLRNYIPGTTSITNNFMRLTESGIIKELKDFPLT